MFIAAYFVARFLWIALLACWVAAKGARARGAMWLPIIVGIVATIWEALIPVQMNIRIDLMLVGPVLMFAEGLAGILLAAAAWQQAHTRQRGVLAFASALCIGASAFFIFAWGYSNKQSAHQYEEYVEGARNYFEAAFRDDDTQRATHGSLEGTRWAGYYVAEPPHPNYGHLVVNSEGDYFLYGQAFQERRGRLKPDAADPALLTGKRIYVGVPMADVEIRDLGGGRLQYRERTTSAEEWTFVKKAPPRFPRAASANDKVRFKGVFSGIYDDSSEKWVGLAQVWLWESDGKWWAVWLRGTHSRLNAQPISGNNRADVICIDKGCESFEIPVEGNRRERFKWETPDTLAWSETKTHIVTLKRGELVTALPHAWAPLTTLEDNRKWLRSMHPEVTWQAPAK